MYNQKYLKYKTKYLAMKGGNDNPKSHSIRVRYNNKPKQDVNIIETGLYGINNIIEILLEKIDSTKKIQVDINNKSETIIKHDGIEKEKVTKLTINGIPINNNDDYIITDINSVYIGTKSLDTSSSNKPPLKRLSSLQRLSPKSLKRQLSSQILGRKKTTQQQVSPVPKKQLKKEAYVILSQDEKNLQELKRLHTIVSILDAGELLHSH